MTAFQIENLGQPNIEIAGFQLWIHGYQYSKANNSFDNNWLEVTAHCGVSGASVFANGSLVQTDDISRWADQCNSLLQNGRGLAIFRSYEPNLLIEITATDKLGHLSMKVEITPDHLAQAHSFEFSIDQSYLPELIALCRAVSISFPVRENKA